MSGEKTKNVGYIFGSKLISFFAGITRGFFVPAYLGPELYGVIGILKLVKIILGFLGSGMDQAYLRLGIDVREKADPLPQLKVLEDNVFSFFVIAAVAGMLGTMAVPFIFKRHDSYLQDLMIFCFFATAIQHLFQTVGLFYFQTMKIQRRFKFISFMNVLQPCIALILIIATVFKWKVKAVFMADLISVAVVQYLYFRKSGIIPRLKIHLKEFRKLAVYAIPFFITGICFYVFRFSDRTIIASFLPLKQLGLYSFAIGLAENSRLLSVSINEVNGPYVIQQISREKDMSNLAPTIKSYSYKLMLLNFVFAFTGIVLSPLIAYVLPDYAPSIFVLKLLLIIMVLRTFPLYQKMILGAPAINKQNHINIAMAISGVINVILSIILVKKGYGINGVVAATLAVHLLMACFYVVASERYYLKKKDPIFYIKMFFPVLVLFLLCLGQRLLPGYDQGGVFINLFFVLILAGAVFLFFRNEASDLTVKIICGLKDGGKP